MYQYLILRRLAEHKSEVTRLSTQRIHHQQMMQSTTIVTMKCHGEDGKPFALDSSTRLADLGDALFAAGFTEQPEDGTEIEVKIGEGSTFALEDLKKNANERSLSELGELTLFYQAAVPPPQSIKVYLHDAAPLGTAFVASCWLASAMARTPGACSGAETRARPARSRTPRRRR